MHSRTRWGSRTQATSLVMHRTVPRVAVALAVVLVATSAQLLVLIMPAGAQTPPSFALEADGPVELAPNAETVFTGNVTLSCLEIAEQQGSATVVLGAAEPPATMNVTGQDVVFTAAECTGTSGGVTKAVSFTATDDGTPAFATFDLVLTATLGSHAQSATLADRFVGYLPGQTMDPEGDQTFDVTGPEFTFPLVLEIQANGDTMVMFEDKVVAGTSSLTGLTATIFDVDGGQTAETLQVRFRAPDGPWERETVTFRTYSHCLDGTVCDPVDERTITWTFLNAQPTNETASMDAPAVADDETEEAAGAAIPLLLLGVLGLAGVRRRK